MEYADLFEAHLEGVNLTRACLYGASLRRAFFDGASILLNVFLGEQQKGFVRLAGVHWGESDLTIIPWKQLTILGDEVIARDRMDFTGKIKDNVKRLEDFKTSVRANRQLATALRDQGLNEEADYFAYRAQQLQRAVWRYEGRWLKYFFSWFLLLLAGYGYRPLRSLFWYLLTIVGFALAYHALGLLSLFPPDALVYSLTSFHGRGFFPGLEHRTTLHDPLIMLAAFEAVIGLFIEISFIATFTQRVFGK